MAKEIVSSRTFHNHVLLPEVIDFFRASCLLNYPRAILDPPIRFSSSLNITSMVSKRFSNFSTSFVMTMAYLFASPARSFLYNLLLICARTLLIMISLSNDWLRR
jgi:hypothetical protein